jgi:hypothetical protein
VAAVSHFHWVKHCGVSCCGLSSKIVEQTGQRHSQIRSFNAQRISRFYPARQLIIAGVVYFLVVLPVNTLLAKFRHPVVAPPATKPCPECLSDIPVAAKRCSHCAQLVA